jgi:hypothetical protein
VTRAVTATFSGPDAALYCCSVDDHDPLADAFSRARDALRSRWVSSLMIAAASLVAVVSATAGVAFGLLAHEFITRATTVWLICFSALMPMVVFAALELRRLCERSDALRDLYAAQRQYEILLRNTRAERDEMKEANALLTQKNAALQTLFGMTVVARAAERENRD